MAKIIIAAVIGVIVVICAFLAIDPNNKGSLTYNSTPTSEVVENDEKISVYISGAIVSPGTYTLKKTNTLQDLIDKAGGIVSSADEDCFDASVTLDGHDSFYIPFISGFSQDCVSTDIEKININTADVETLATINGISTAVAEKIVKYREENGPFSCLEDIINVSGIGSKTFEKIRDYICIK